MSTLFAYVLNNVLIGYAETTALASKLSKKFGVTISVRSCAPGWKPVTPERNIVGKVMALTSHKTIKADAIDAMMIELNTPEPEPVKARVRHEGRYFFKAEPEKLYTFSEAKRVAQRTHKAFYPAK